MRKVKVWSELGRSRRNKNGSNAESSSVSFFQVILASNEAEKEKFKDDFKMYMKYESFEKYLERDDEKLKKKLDKVLDDLEYSVNKHKIDK